MPWLVEHWPSLLTFGVGLVIGYGRATARVAVMENQIAELTRQVTRLENLMLYGSTVKPS